MDYKYLRWQVGHGVYSEALKLQGLREQQQDRVQQNRPHGLQVLCWQVGHGVAGRQEHGAAE